MDDITNQLNQILSDPQSMAQIQNIMSGLGLGGDAVQSQPTPNVPLNQELPKTANLNQGIDLSMITKLAPLLGQIKQDDNSTRLLTALKPMLSQERQSKIDQSMRILQLMKLFPLLKDNGMLSSILGGLF